MLLYTALRSLIYIDCEDRTRFAVEQFSPVFASFADPVIANSASTSIAGSPSCSRRLASMRGPELGVGARPGQTTASRSKVGASV